MPGAFGLIPGKLVRRGFGGAMSGMAYVPRAFALAPG